MLGIVDGDGQDKPKLGVQHTVMQSRGHTGLGLTRRFDSGDHSAVTKNFTAPHP